jgi:threonine/homoserine/homoserine lactone efflux protein
MDTIADMSIVGVPLAFLWTAFLIELTPGPNMSYLAVLSLAEGRRAGFAAVAGVATGLLIVGLVAALGLAAIISQSAVLYAILRWAGVLYLAWLAYDIWTGGDSDVLSDGTKDGGWYHFFSRGLITNMLNPKAAMFYITVLPPFVDPARSALNQTLGLSIAYVAVATLIHLGIVTIAATARAQLGNAAKMSGLRRVLAVSVLIIAIWLASSTRLTIGA